MIIISLSASLSVIISLRESFSVRIISLCACFSVMIISLSASLSVIISLRASFSVRIISLCASLSVRIISAYLRGVIIGVTIVIGGYVHKVY